MYREVLYYWMSNPEEIAQLGIATYSSCKYTATIYDLVFDSL